MLPKSIPEPAFQPLASKAEFTVSPSQVRTSFSSCKHGSMISLELSCTLGSQRCVIYHTGIFCCAYGSILAQLICLPFSMANDTNSRLPIFIAPLSFLSKSDANLCPCISLSQLYFLCEFICVVLRFFCSLNGTNTN